MTVLGWQSLAEKQESMSELPASAFDSRQSCLWYADTSSESSGKVRISRSCIGSRSRTQKPKRKISSLHPILWQTWHCLTATTVMASPFYSSRSGILERRRAADMPCADFLMLIRSRPDVRTSRFRSAECADSVTTTSVFAGGLPSIERQSCLHYTVSSKLVNTVWRSGADKCRDY